MTAVYRERLPAFSADAGEVVLLTGWASSSHIWRHLLPALRQDFNITLLDLPLDAEDPLAALLPYLPQRAVYLGWSLGGMIATRLAARHPRRVSGLVTVASNSCFVANDAWPAAMAPATFDSFYRLFEQRPDKGLSRFQLLQSHGDEQRDRVMAALSGLPHTQSHSALLTGLNWLRDWDNTSELTQIACPTMHVFGESDALVPVSAATAIAERCADQHCEVMAGCGHLPFVSRAADFLACCQRFFERSGLLGESALQREQHWLSDRQFKRDVARSFSRAAQSYDSVAELQRRVADRLLASLPDCRDKRLVDLGCGTGYSLPALAERAGGGELLALDIAEGMLDYARQRCQQAADTQVDQWICGDAEDLPLADDSVDVIFSSLSLQWCHKPGALYTELERVLRPGGVAVIATLGPETLHELRAAWQQVDGYVHVNAFESRATIEEAIHASRLHLDSWLDIPEAVYYQRLGELTRELKSLGAHNVNDGRPGGLTGRQRLSRLTAAYEQFRDDEGRLPASYQVWNITVSKPYAEH